VYGANAYGFLIAAFLVFFSYEDNGVGVKNGALFR